MDRVKKELNVQIGKRLREIRENLGFTQSKFAEILNVGEEHYRKIELGATGLTVEKVQVLYKVLNIDANYLILGEKPDLKDLDHMLTNCSRTESIKILHRILKYVTKLLEQVDDEQSTI